MSNKKILLIVVAVFIIAGGFCWHTKNGGLPGNLTSRWQAVFLTDGQVYFGKLENENSSFAKLKEVYYLKISESLQRGSSDAGLSGRNLNLVKLGGEAHRPEGEMYISKSQIMFIENLKSDSTVVAAILNSQN